MNGAHGRAGQRGVTLVELLVTMSIAVILLTVGVSGMTTLFRTNARAADVNALVGYLNFARAQAIMRATSIRVCPVDPDDPAAGCDADADGTSWANGYAVVQVDGDGNTVAVLRVQPGIDRFVVDSGGRKGFEFEDDGTVGFRDDSGNGTITFCDKSSDGVDGVGIVVSTMGRIRLDADPIDCADDDADGDGGD